MIQRSNSDEPVAITLTYAMLHGKYPVLQELLDCIRLQLGDLHWHLHAYERYRARRLCGEPFWALLTKDERKLAGSCISHLAREGQLPLVKVSKQGCYPNEYEATDWPINLHTVAVETHSTRTSVAIQKGRLCPSSN